MKNIESEKKFNILFIENNQFNIKLIENVLSNINFNISFIEKEEKIKNLKDSLKYFNLIVISQFSNLNKLEETINFIKTYSTFSNIILILEIEDFSKLEEKLLEFDIYHFLIKPFNIYEFKFLVNHACNDSYLKIENEKLINNLKKANLILQEQKIEMTKNFIQLKELQDELIKKEKLSTIGIFTSSILHDIKNSLGIISGYSEFISMKDQSLQKYTNKIQDEVNSLLITLQDLLDFVRGTNIENYNFENYKLDRFVNYINEIFNDYINRLTKINPHFESKIENSEKYFVRIDPIRLKRVLINLIKNAYEACVSSNKNIYDISIIIEPTTNINNNDENNEIKIEIKDNGIGISEENLPKLFQTFFTSGKKGGTGLGLSISNNIIKNLNGKMEVKSKYGEGTSFIIFLPLKKL